MDKKILIKIKNKIAVMAKPLPIVCGNSDYTAVFEFDGDWDDYNTKTARFVTPCADPIDVIFGGDSCPIPAIADAPYVEIGVYAGDIRTSTPAYVRCLCSITSGGGSPADPPESVYNQLMELLNDLNELSDEELAAAVEGYFAEHPVAEPPDWEQNDETAKDYIKNKPKSLPNPKAIKITGAAEATYDGSEPVEVFIPRMDTNAYDPTKIITVPYMTTSPILTKYIAQSSANTRGVIADDAATVTSSQYDTVYVLGLCITKLHLALSAKNLATAKGLVEDAFVALQELVDGGYIVLPFVVHYGSGNPAGIEANTLIDIRRMQVYPERVLAYSIAIQYGGGKLYMQRYDSVDDMSETTRSFPNTIDNYYFTKVESTGKLSDSLYSAAHEGKVIAIENGEAVPKALPAIPEWAQADEKPSYIASEVGADASGTAAAAVTAHNTATTAHDDIRQLVASKVAKSDIVNNLTSADTNKPLSAAQGRELKAFIDDIDVPTSLPNPNALTVKGGATEQSYNGSAAKSIIFPYAMPQFYGAVGNGTTDDTTAVQSALANNRYVYIPAGTYKLSGTLTVRAGCRLELAPDAVLNFTQTSGNCIALGISSCLCGNHATVVVPYAFTGNAVYVSSAAVTSLTDVPPFTRWTPQWKPARYLTDLNITKPDSRGFHYSVDGTCSGKAVYIEADGSATSTFIWGLNFSGLRIAGAFSYGIHAKAVSNGWNHDMHLEAVIDGCEIGICLEDCNNNYITATIQPRAALTTDNQSVAYAKHGIQLIRSRNTDLSATRVWDWNAANTLWTSGGQYQHIAMVGNCSGTILSDFLYYETSYDIRSLIYTDTPSNLEKMTILQEPFTRWFKPSSDGLTPYFYNGTSNKELLQKDAFDAVFQTQMVGSFTNKLSTAANADGTVFNTVGYQNGKQFAVADGTTIVDLTGNTITGFIPCAANDIIRLKGISFATNNYGAARIFLYDSNHTKLVHVNQSLVVTNGSYYNIDSYTATTDGCSFRIVKTNAAYFRLSVDTSTLSTDPVVTVNEQITYTQAGFLADSVNVKASSVYGLEDFVKAVIAANG